MHEIVTRFNKAFFNQEWEEVIRLKDEVLTVIEAVGNYKALAVYFVNLGIAYRRVSDHNKAIECQIMACEFYEKIENENGQGYCYVNLGLNYHDLGLFDEAREFFERAYKIAIKTDDDGLLAVVQKNGILTEVAIRKRTTVIIDNGKELRFQSRQTVDPSKKSVPYDKRDRTVLDLSNRDKIFVSYSHNDSHIVKTIIKDLNNSGFSFFFDKKDRPTNDPHSLGVGLGKGLTQSYAMLVCLSQNYVNSEWCRAEIHDFIFQSILEGRIKRVPILILEIDGHVSNEELFTICFSKLATTKDPTHFHLKSMEFQIKNILEKNNLELAQIVNSLERIPFHKPTTTNPRIKQISLKLEEIKEIWLEQKKTLKPTFSSIKDFYFLWDESLERSAPNKSENEKDRLLDALVSRFPEQIVFPLFTDTKTLWSFLFSYYKHKTVAQKIEIDKVIEKFMPPTNFDLATQNSIDQLFEPSSLRILQGIAQKEQNIYIFDKLSIENSQYYRNLKETLESGRKQLETRVLRGHPIQLIFGEAQRRNFVIPLRYTYYKYLKDNPRNEMVDTAVIAAFLINVDMWKDKITTLEEFEKYIIDPLMYNDQDFV
jgi:tetratricopeptide (TPR) repeat protein